MSFGIGLSIGIVVGMSCPFVAFVLFKEVLIRFINTMVANQKPVATKPTLADLTQAVDVMKQVKGDKRKPYRPKGGIDDGQDVT